MQIKIKIKSLSRRQLSYGFQEEKDRDGEVVGDSVVRLARRNAFELVGLRRPTFEHAWQWKVN